jgi:hypothetical protein
MLRVFGGFRVWDRQPVPNNYITLFGFPSGPTKVVEIIVLQLLQFICVLLKKMPEPLLFSYCSEFCIMNLCLMLLNTHYYEIPPFLAKGLSLNTPFRLGSIVDTTMEPGVNAPNVPK